MDLKVYGAYIDPSLDSDLEVQCIGLVDKPAIERNFLAFKKAQETFAVNDDRRIIFGPAMIADTPIYRNDAAWGEYYVTFDKASIFSIVEKFSARGFMQKFNLFHDGNAAVNQCTIVSSFITDSSLGIKAPAAFSDVPEGSWFIGVHINNDDVWKGVKDGLIKGFSVEGFFEYLPMKQAQKMSKATALEKILELINQTDFDK